MTLPLRSLLLLLPVTVGLASCTGFGEGGLAGAACPELTSGGAVLNAQISGDARANVKVRAFVQAAKDLSAVSLQAEAEIAGACRRMAADLGIPPNELAARNEPGGQASGACAAVSARIDAILRSGASVQVSVTPPQCTANANAEAACQGSCSAQLSPGEIVARCEPAKLSGMCQGRCDGHCDGRCTGECRGTCSAKDAQGRCIGQCNGDCGGSCDATCHTRCSGTWQAPRCETQISGPSADAECNGSCRAHANVNAQCSPAVVQARAGANTDAAMRLAATLQANLPALIHAQIALGKRLMADVQVVGQIGAQLPKIVGQAGGHALACIAASANATASASARLNVSVSASASVSGKVGAGG